MKKRTNLILGIVQIFVALGALPAGYSMIVEPSGRDLGMTVEALEGSPFSNYLIPGIALFTINGLFNIAGALFSFRRSRLAGPAGLVLGTAMIVWIVVQVNSVGLSHFLQPAYFAIGIFEIYLSVIILRNRSNGNKTVQY